MKHIFNQPQFGENWFTYPWLYTKLAKDAPNGSTIVEVGSWKGKSAAFMAVTIANLKKDIAFYCIDTWKGSAEHVNHEEVKKDTLYSLFLSNVEPVKKYLHPIRLTSVEASKNFEDESIYAVFIDASHEYKDVKEDIQHWLPKIQKGGILCGHDYGYKDVRIAVNEIFGTENMPDELGFEPATKSEGCWVHRVKDK